MDNRETENSVTFLLIYVVNLEALLELLTTDLQEIILETTGQKKEVIQFQTSQKIINLLNLILVDTYIIDRFFLILGFGGNRGGGRNWNNHDDRGSYGRDGGRDRGYGK